MEWITFSQKTNCVCTCRYYSEKKNNKHCGKSQKYRPEIWIKLGILPLYIYSIQIILFSQLLCQISVVSQTLWRFNYVTSNLKILSFLRGWKSDLILSSLLTSHNKEPKQEQGSSLYVLTIIMAWSQFLFLKLRIHSLPASPQRISAS